MLVMKKGEVEIKHHGDIGRNKQWSASTTSKKVGDGAMAREKARLPVRFFNRMLKYFERTAEEGQPRAFSQIVASHDRWFTWRYTQ